MYIINIHTFIFQKCICIYAILYEAKYKIELKTNFTTSKRKTIWLANIGITCNIACIQLQLDSQLLAPFIHTSMDK